MALRVVSALLWAIFLLAANGEWAAAANPVLLPTARGPSYFCATPNLTRVERTICGDPALSKLDLQLGTAAADVLIFSTDAVRANEDESRWLADVRTVCRDAVCLASAYRDRLAHLQAIVRVRDPWAAAHAPRRVQLDPALQRRLAALVPEECLESFSVEALDLGDGRRSILETDCGHGNHNVQKDLFRPENGRYRLVYSDGAANGFGSITLQRPRAHGLYRLRSIGGANCCENGYVYLDFDGAEYHPVACGDQQYVTEKIRRFVISSCVPGITN